MSTQTTQAGELEFVFWAEEMGTSTSRCAVCDIRLIGTTNWTMPSELARSGHLYTFDVTQNAIFPANLSATSFTTAGNITLGGSLKKGSYTYTLPNKNGTVAMTGDIPAPTEYSAGDNIEIDENNVISATDTTYTGGNRISIDENSVINFDGMTILAYGKSTWNDFITAYNAQSIVYCRASSQANPASGAQTRMAFMAYVNNEENPTSVEFQYVRSVSSKTEAQPVDQVFVYTLTSTNGGTWSVATRNMAPKITAGTGINVSYSNGTYTISLA